MLVDDHDIVRKGLAKIVMNEDGMKIVGEAKNGMEALEKVQELMPDAIVMDINMPEMNGVEATKKIKAKWPMIKIIGLSFYEDKKIAEVMRKAGASAFITKSNVIKELCSAIRSLG
jgi:DNA-binding NarL/FixJ family response regulator